MSGRLRRMAIILLLLATLGPALLTTAAQVIETTLAPSPPASCGFK